MVILGPGQQFGVDMASFQTFSNAQEEPHSHSAELISRAVRVELPPNRIADNIETCVDDNSLAETLELAEMTECAIVDGERVSSQAIREAIQQQNFDLVNRKLGRRYALRGLVVKGEQRGRQIGFPTANIGHIETIIPPAGVYHCLTTIRNQTFPVAVSIGYNQTFGANLPISVEGHIIANPAHSTAATKFNLYGKYLTIEFVRLLRPMRKFNSVNELIAQISDDVRQILSSNLSESN
jgi:riboflavin kinase/FMN adenylyltransferase